MRVIQRLEFGDVEGHPFHGNQWTTQGSESSFGGHDVTSAVVTQSRLAELNAELTRQGVREDSPIRAVVDHPGAMLAVSRADGKISGAIAFDLGSRAYGTEGETRLLDVRAMDKGAGAGRALMQHVAADTLAHGNTAMATYAGVPGAEGFYRRLGGADLNPDNPARNYSSLRWEGPYLRALADGHPIQGPPGLGMDPSLIGGLMLALSEALELVAEDDTVTGNQV